MKDKKINIKYENDTNLFTKLLYKIEETIIKMQPNRIK